MECTCDIAACWKFIYFLFTLLYLFYCFKFERLQKFKKKIVSTYTYLFHYFAPKILLGWSEVLKQTVDNFWGISSPGDEKFCALSVWSSPNWVKNRFLLEFDVKFASFIFTVKYKCKVVEFYGFTVPITNKYKKQLQACTNDTIEMRKISWSTIEKNWLLNDKWSHL